MMFKDFYYRLVTSVLASSLWWYGVGESKRGSLRVLVKNGFVVTWSSGGDDVVLTYCRVVGYSAWGDLWNVGEKTLNVIVLRKSVLIVTARGVTYLFPVQVKTFHPVFSGKDVIAQARTGTGKTFSFAIPLIEKLQADSQEKRRGRAPKVTELECWFCCCLTSERFTALAPWKSLCRDKLAHILCKLWKLLWKLYSLGLCLHPVMPHALWLRLKSTVTLSTQQLLFLLTRRKN